MTGTVTEYHSTMTIHLIVQKNREDKEMSQQSRNKKWTIQTSVSRTEQERETFFPSIFVSEIVW